MRTKSNSHSCNVALHSPLPDFWKGTLGSRFRKRPRHGHGYMGRCARAGAAATDGAALRVAECRGRAAYPDLGAGGPPQLVVQGAEVRGRWSACPCPPSAN